MLLNQKSINIYKKDNEGRTALMHACRNNNDVAAEILLKQIVNINEKDNNGNEDYSYNVLSFCPIGGLYGLGRQNITSQKEIKDLSTGDTNISLSTISVSSFVFKDGSFEFDSISNECKNGEKSKGSHYKVVYKKDKFELPEFMELIKC